MTKNQYQNGNEQLKNINKDTLQINLIYLRFLKY